MHFLVMMICLLISSSCSAGQLGATQPTHLNADMSFHFVCRQNSRPGIEKDIELFLRSGGFRGLNQGEIQRQHNVHILDTSIVALDGNNKMIEVRSVPGADSRFAFYLYSEPPTKHFSSFESEILNFVSNRLGCEIRQLARKENEEEQRDSYQSELRRIERLLENADQFDGNRRI